MEELVVSLFQNYPVLSTVLALVLAAHGLAVVIVNLTPTPKDDEVLAKVYAVVKWVAGIVTKDVKNKGGEE